MSYQGGAAPSEGEYIGPVEMGKGASNGHSSSASHKPLIETPEGSYHGSKSTKESEYGGQSTTKIWWWQHPDIRQNWRAVLGSIVLLIVGILILAAGIVLEASKHEHVASAIFIIIGFLFLVPGLYHTGYIYFAAKGIRGFEMKQLSIFNMSR